MAHYGCSKVWSPAEDCLLASALDSVPPFTPCRWRQISALIGVSPDECRMRSKSMAFLNRGLHDVHQAGYPEVFSPPCNGRNQEEYRQVAHQPSCFVVPNDSESKASKDHNLVFTQSAFDSDVGSDDYDDEDEEEHHYVINPSGCDHARGDRVLVLGGLGILRFDEDIYVNSLRPHGWETIKFRSNSAIERLRETDVCIVATLTPNCGRWVEQFVGNEEWRQALTKWVNQGGSLIFAGGEGNSVLVPLNVWFKLPWTFGFDHYRRRDHDHHNSGSAIPNIGNYCVKACMLSSVPGEHQVYSTDDGQCAVAYANVGNGTVAFFGDVNAQEETRFLIAALAAQGRRTPAPAPDPDSDDEFYADDISRMPCW